MANKTKQPRGKGTIPKLPSQDEPKKSQSPQAIRETVESIVIAFVLAFLFRTFEAEAFVIPTGSMAPTLMGRHKDATCPQCGYRFPVNCSNEDPEEAAEAFRERRITSPQDLLCVAGTCPMCRYTMPMQKNLPPDVPEVRRGEEIANLTSYNGDRILVNKYIYCFTDPKRWDVVVFKYPGNAQMNYIKRLVGLPEETLRIYQGDLFVGGPEAREDSAFQIALKPADKVFALRQLVHDTKHGAAELEEVDWPARWNAWPRSEDASGGWTINREVVDDELVQRFESSGQNEDLAWMRYQHFVPSYEQWTEALRLHAAGQSFSESQQQAIKPQLITDFNGYNTTVSLAEAKAHRDLRLHFKNLDHHWVGDLLVEANVEVQSAEGEFVLLLVEAGQEFRCHFDLATGEATLEIPGGPSITSDGATPLGTPGTYQVTFANVDDQLLLWVDGDQVPFASPTTYDTDAVFGGRRTMRPMASDEDPGDLAPAGIGVRQAQLVVDRLRVYRDIYYIATNWRFAGPVNDADVFNPSQREANLTEPSQWDAYLDRRHVDFPLAENQYFVMGDNSPASLDARLWRGPNGPHDSGQPGGAYLERRMLIGKALCVYWPHSWNRIPGTPIPFPLFPNFSDMRLVR